MSGMVFQTILGLILYLNKNIVSDRYIRGHIFWIPNFGFQISDQSKTTLKFREQFKILKFQEICLKSNTKLKEPVKPCFELNGKLMYINLER